MSTITVVTLTRRRHPFEGRPLPVLGSMLRHGVCELLVALPDALLSPMLYPLSSCLSMINFLSYLLSYMRDPSYERVSFHLIVM